jgi:phage portal protein BeeE
MRLSQRLAGGRKDFHSSSGFSERPFWSYEPMWGSNAASDRESIANDFAAYVDGAYKASGVVFACMLARESLFSEARFMWRQRVDGRAGRLFGNQDLRLLERPWPGGTTGELLSRMIQDADLAGNFYATTVDDNGNVGRASRGGPGRRLARMRPDWVTIVLGSRSNNPHAIDTRVVAYEYNPPPTAIGDRLEPVLLLPSEVVHFSPRQDPGARFRGMSWLTPALREIEADKAATRHKLKFFERGATIQTVVSLDKDVTPEQFDEFVERFREKTEGVDQAYKTLFLGGGADVTLNGSTMQQLDFKVTQGSGETRIASDSGMHPVIVGLSEGLEGSSLNAGNFQAAIRLTADKTIRPLWRNAASSLSTILPSPGDGTELWYDDREVAFLRDDSTDVAEIQGRQATTASVLTNAGFTPDSVVSFIDSGDLTVLVHSGLYSVQLQRAGAVGTLGSMNESAALDGAASPGEA